MNILYPDRHAVLDRVVHLLMGGWRIADLVSVHGLPTQSTLWRWVRDDPAWRQPLAEAFRQSRSHRRRALTLGRSDFRPDLAAAFLDEVRRGARAADVVRRPGGLTHAVMVRWRREDPDFRAALAAAVRAGRRVRPYRRHPYDEATADRIVLRVDRGESLAEILREPGMPGEHAFRRWRRTVEGLDGAVRIACGRGAAVRARRLTACTPKIVARVERAIVSGATLADLDRRKGFPRAATMYRWLGERPEFAAAVETASRFRDEHLHDDKLDVIATLGKRPLAAVKRDLGRLNHRLANTRKRRPWAHER